MWVGVVVHRMHIQYVLCLRTPVPRLIAATSWGAVSAHALSVPITAGEQAYAYVRSVLSRQNAWACRDLRKMGRVIETP